MMGHSGRALACCWSILLVSGAVLQKNSTTIVQNAAGNASAAEAVAKTAAKLANDVAKHTVDASDDAQMQLERARGAIRDARSQTAGLSDEQRALLKSADKDLRDATLRAEYGKLMSAQYVVARNRTTWALTKTNKLYNLEKRLASRAASAGQAAETKRLRGELEEIRRALGAKGREAAVKQVKYVNDAGTADDKSDDITIPDLLERIKKLECKVKDLEDGVHPCTVSIDDLKCDIQKLREDLAGLQPQKLPSLSFEIPRRELDVAHVVMDLPKRRAPLPPAGNLRYNIPDKVYEVHPNLKAPLKPKLPCDEDKKEKQKQQAQ